MIVVVEDEAAVLEGMRVLLEGWGAEVVAGASVRETMESLEPLARAPDLIVADYRLRDGNVGTQAIIAVRDRFRARIPAIIVSGSTTAGAHRRGEGDGRPPAAQAGDAGEAADADSLQAAPGGGPGMKAFCKLFRSDAQTAQPTRPRT